MEIEKHWIKEFPKQGVCACACIGGQRGKVRKQKKRWFKSKTAP